MAADSFSLRSMHRITYPRIWIDEMGPDEATFALYHTDMFQTSPEPQTNPAKL